MLKLDLLGCLHIMQSRTSPAPYFAAPFVILVPTLAIRSPHRALVEILDVLVQLGDAYLSDLHGFDLEYRNLVAEF